MYLEICSDYIDMLCSPSLDLRCQKNCALSSKHGALFYGSV